MTGYSLLVTHKYLVIEWHGSDTGTTPCRACLYPALVQELASSDSCTLMAQTRAGQHAAQNGLG